jgi:hypothetical protein
MNLIRIFFTAFFVYAVAKVVIGLIRSGQQRKDQKENEAYNEFSVRTTDNVKTGGWQKDENGFYVDCYDNTNDSFIKDFQNTTDPIEKIEKVMNKGFDVLQKVSLIIFTIVWFGVIIIAFMGFIQDGLYGPMLFMIPFILAGIYLIIYIIKCFKK